MNSPDYLISTPENVDLHLELAGLGSRLWAAFIDLALIYLGILIVALIGGFASGMIEAMSLPRETKNTLYLYIVGVCVLLIFCLQFGYYILFEKLWQGQTPGKRIAHIRVIEANGQPVNWGGVIIRNLIRIVDMGLLMIGVVLMIFDKHERRLGDMLGGTLVIHERQPELSPRLLNITAEPPPISFVDAGQITPDEYHLLVSFLRRRKTMYASSRFTLARELETYFRKKLNPEAKGESAENFLEKVYLAYSARAQLEAS